MLSRLTRIAGIGIATLLLTIPVAYIAAASSLEAVAWAKAMGLAKATPAEVAPWAKPVTTIYNTPRYDPVSATDGVRRCGEIVTVLEGERGTSLHLVFYVSVWARAVGEEKLIMSTLVHEYLHLIWLNRSLADAAWADSHPDSETYVRMLIPDECPAN